MINFIKKTDNIKVVFNYINESIHIINQGFRVKDKIILAIYFFKIPVFLIKSLIYNKHIREFEEKNKFLIGDVIIKNKYGKYFCGDNILTVYIADENYEKHFYPFLKPNNGLFIDVGAHIGKYTVKLGTSCNTNYINIIAIEPEKYNFQLLVKNIKLNNLNNVIAINKGVYSNKEKIPFYIFNKGEGDHSVIKRSDDCKEIQIDVDTLDNILCELKVEKKIECIKIDVEGSEVHAVQGALNTIKKHKPKMIIEILKENKSNIENIEKLLIPIGYKRFKIDEDNYFYSI